MQAPKKMFKVLSRRQVFEGPAFNVRRDVVVDSDGREFERDVIVHPGAVAIVARPTPDEVILIHQYRHAVGEEIIEIPAGTLNAGEHPRETALRELEEETGYRAQSVVERARFYSTPGFTNEVMYIFEATGLSRTEMNLDDDESIAVEIVPVPAALEWIADGRIRDAKTIAGILMVLKP